MRKIFRGYFSCVMANEKVDDKCVEASDEARKSTFRIDPDELASINGDGDNLAARGGVEGVAEEVMVSISHGVCESEIPLRQEIFGENKYEEKPPKSFWSFVWDALQDLTLMVLMVCAVVSIGVGIASEGWPEGVYDGLGIVLSITLVVIVTSVSDYRQSIQFRELEREKKKIEVQVTRDGSKKKVWMHDLVVGDVVHLSIGDQVPADGLFVSGYSLWIDGSALSGESQPVAVDQEKPYLSAGTKVHDGSGRMLVTSVGRRTEWGKLMDTLSQGNQSLTPLQVKLNGVAIIIGKIGLAFAGLTFTVLLGRYVVGKARHGELLKWKLDDVLILINYFAISVAIIVVAVPEGLPLAVTLSLAFAMKKLIKDKALVKHLSACETMGSVSCICTDKTGTLTTNHMVVDRIWLCEEIKQCRCIGRAGSLWSNVPEEVVKTLLQALLLNTNSEVVIDKTGKNMVLGTPTEAALLEFGLLFGKAFSAAGINCRVIKVDPFNSVKKKMSALVQLQDGRRRAFCKGGSEIVLQMCDKMIKRDGKVVGITEKENKVLLDVIEKFSCNALRTLCVAVKDVGKHLNNDEIPFDGYTLLAILGIKDPVRPEVVKAVKICNAAGIAVKMITGDNISTAKAIAKECGILTEGGLAIEGSEFRSKSLDEMKELIPIIQVMARSMPSDKCTLVSHLRSMFKEVVAVTGDGTNDAPAMHEADIGLAMGKVGTEVAKENADVIIMDDNFNKIVKVAEWGRTVYQNIQKFVQFQLTVNVVVLIVSFASSCITGNAPLTAVQLLWVNLIMDTFGALALATGPQDEELMKRPPIKQGTGFITRTMWRNIIGQAIYQLAVLVVFMTLGKKVVRINTLDKTDTLNTFIFNTFIFCQIFNEINSLELEKLNVFKSIFGNRIFVAVVAFTVLFQVIIVEFLGNFASTVPLSWELWVLSILVASISLVIAVVLKCIPVEVTKPPQRNVDGYEELPGGPEGMA